MQRAMSRRAVMMAGLAAPLLADLATAAQIAPAAMRGDDGELFQQLVREVVHRAVDQRVALRFRHPLADDLAGRSGRDAPDGLDGWRRIRFTINC